MMTRIVVGVSATSGSRSALLAAADQARLTSAELAAVQAWRPPRPPSSPGGHPPAVSRDVDASRGAAETLLRSHVTEALGADALGADADVTCKLVQASPRAVLLAESEHADLPVLDASRTPTSTGPQRLVTRLISDVRCPILVMPSAQKAGAPQR